MEHSDIATPTPLLPAVLDAITDGLLALDRHWTITYLNRHAERLVRHGREEVIGQDFWAHFPELVSTPVEAQVRTAMERSANAALDAYCPERQAWFHLRLHPLPDGLAILFHDVTLRKQAEQALQESQEWLRRATAAADIGTWRVDLRTRLDTRDGNLNRILGLEPVETTQPVDDFLARVHPEDQQLVSMALERAISQRSAYECDCRLVRPDGTVRHVRDQGQIIFDSDGQPRYMTGAVVDLTARRQAEEVQRFLSEASRLLASSLDYRTTLETVARLALPHLADLCIVDIIEEGSLRYVALAHVDPAKEALLRQLRAQYQPDPSWPDHPMAEVMRTGVSALFPIVDESLREAAARDAEHLRIMRALNFCSYIIVPLVAHDQTFGTISLARATPDRPYEHTDLSLAQELARRAALAITHAQLYQAAQEALQARDQFLSIAAHELKTPVTSIKGNAQFLLRAQRRGSLDGERLSRALEAIDERSNHLAQLVSDLLDVSRLRLGQMPLHLMPLDLAPFLDEIISRYQEQAEPKHRFVFAASDPIASVQADAARLEQVLTNLLDNALKYSPAGGTITIEMRPDDSGVLIEVRDEGIGLPQENAEAIFEPFGRASNAESQQLPGLGLGLFICRQIIERHGGRLWAESDGEDQGTTMRIWLPAAMQAGAGSGP